MSIQDSIYIAAWWHSRLSSSKNVNTSSWHVQTPCLHCVYLSTILDPLARGLYDQQFLTPLNLLHLPWLFQAILGSSIFIGLSCYLLLLLFYPILEYTLGDLAGVTCLVWNFQHSACSLNQDLWNKFWFLILISDPESRFNLDLKYTIFSDMHLQSLDYVGASPRASVFLSSCTYLVTGLIGWEWILDSVGASNSFDWNLDSVGASHSFDTRFFSDYVGATVYSLPDPVEFRVDCSCCVYFFFKSQDGLCLLSYKISFIPQIFVGVDTSLCVKILCYFSHLRLLVHSCVGVLDPQDQCAVVTLVVSTSFQ